LVSVSLCLIDKYCVLYFENKNKYFWILEWRIFCPIFNFQVIFNFILIVFQFKLILFKFKFTISNNQSENIVFVCIFCSHLALKYVLFKIFQTNIFYFYLPVKWLKLHIDFWNSYDLFNLFLKIPFVSF
jgi:hypothetical protein